MSGVFPANGFTNRTLTVEISGDSTEWTDGATVDFGAGVTVNDVRVASPSAIFADITIANTAEAGPHDVTITDRGRGLILEQSFVVDSPISISFEGTLAQGSVAFFTIKNKDVGTPFDTTDLGNPLFGSDFINLVFTAPAGTDMAVNSATPFSLSGSISIDVDAAPGTFSLASGPTGEEDVFETGETIAIAPRTATVMASGITNGTVPNPLETQLYEFTPTGTASFTKFTAASADPDATPGFILLGPSGSFTDVIDFSDVVGQLQVGTPQKFFLIYFDNSGAAPYSYTLDTAATALTTQAEAEPNNTAPAAKTATFATLVNASSLATAADEDWYKITVVAGDIGKSVHVVTIGGDDQTDTVVEVFRDAAGTLTLGGPSADSDFHEDFISDPIPAATTTVTVKVSASTAFDATFKNYQVAIFLE